MHDVIERTDVWSTGEKGIHFGSGLIWSRCYTFIMFHGSIDSQSGSRLLQPEWLWPNTKDTHVHRCTYGLVCVCVWNKPELNKTTTSLHVSAFRCFDRILDKVGHTFKLAPKRTGHLNFSASFSTLHTVNVSISYADFNPISFFQTPP